MSHIGHSRAMAGAALFTAVAVALVSLLGAVLGGVTGMRYHRRVDRAGFEEA